MKQIKVFYDQKLGHRDRQRDTYKYAPKSIAKITNNINKDRNNIDVKRYHDDFLRKIAVKYLTKLPLINFRKIPKRHEQADFSYIWGYLPLNCKNKYVVELDNPYCLTFYNKLAFKLFKTIIRKKLMETKCHKITCMSEACKNQLIQELGPKIKHKVFVHYPFSKSREQNNNKNDKLHFLYVGFDIKRKGLLDFLEVYKTNSDDKMHLTIIGSKDERLNKYEAKNITVTGEVKREDIFEKYYPKADVLVFPTYHETFGVVLLEALSFSLGAITTNTYAIPEMVNHKINGYVIRHPFLKEETLNDKLCVNVTKYKLSEFNKKYENKIPCKRMQNEIKKAILEAKENYNEWKEQSKRIFQEKFSEESWKKNHLRLFE